jgi:hypothetical protein
MPTLQDHPWSSSETQQIEGRVQRHGQKRQVIVYPLIAPKTPDEFLQGYASGKKLMMQVSTQECVTRGWPGFELESDIEESVSLEEEPCSTKVAPRTKKDVQLATEGPSSSAVKPTAQPKLKGKSTCPAPPTRQKTPATLGKIKLPTKAALERMFPELGKRPRKADACDAWDVKAAAKYEETLSVVKDSQSDTPRPGTVMEMPTAPSITDQPASAVPGTSVIPQPLVIPPPTPAPMLTSPGTPPPQATVYPLQEGLEHAPENAENNATQLSISDANIACGQSPFAPGLTHHLHSLTLGNRDESDIFDGQEGINELPETRNHRLSNYTSPGAGDKRPREPSTSPRVSRNAPRPRLAGLDNTATKREDIRSVVNNAKNARGRGAGRGNNTRLASISK